MHIGEEATGTSEGNKDDHEDFEDDASGLVFDVMGKDDGNNKENRGNYHDVTGGEAWFTGTVRTSGEDDEFIKNEISDDHESQG